MLRSGFNQLEVSYVPDDKKGKPAAVVKDSSSMLPERVQVI